MVKGSSINAINTNEMDDPNKKAAELEKVVAMLSEHYDAIQIVASELLSNGSTRSIRRGSGNWYARRALCQEFVEMDQAQVMASELGKEIKKDNG